MSYINIMKILMNMLLLALPWIPRIIFIVFVLVISLFELGELFTTHPGFWESLLGILVLLIAIGILILSWRWPWIGGVIFVLLGIAYFWAQETPDAIIYVPVLLIAGMFLASWFLRKQINKARESYWNEMGW
jgi:hypothetical protein